MKKLIKELAKVEGRKSQTAIGNLRETMKVLAAILASDQSTYGENGYTEEINKYVNTFLTKANKKIKKNINITYQELLDYLLK